MVDSDIATIGAADLVIGLAPASRDAQGIEGAIARITQLAPAVRAVLAHPPYSPTETNPPQTESAWHLVATPQLASDPSAVVQSLEDSFRAIADMTQKLGAKACAFVASDLSTVTAEWIELLSQPIVDDGFDLIAPCYARHPFEGMINRAIIYPLFRALYGKQIRNPIGPDFGVSGKLLERFATTPKARVHPLMSLAAEATVSGMKIGQTNLGPRVYATPDSTNLSSLLAQTLGPLLLDVERHAAVWQRARGSQAVPEFGNQLLATGQAGAVDTTRLIESFQLATRNLTEVWGIILPPSTLVELRVLARQDAGAFRFSDESWARIIWDFALAHRLRAIGRDQMLRALTPIYLGWLASYALGLDSLAPEAVEQRLERLCLAYENTKPYFVSRWRWPDRFNP